MKRYTPNNSALGMKIRGIFEEPSLSESQGIIKHDGPSRSQSLALNYTHQCLMGDELIKTAWLFSQG